MTDVDDDDISITSTAPSEQQSEYEVETILTEAQLDDGILYLVKWAGYPIERSTWEPAESFSTDETFADWKKKKKAIAEGRKPPFDVVSWEEHLSALDQARDQRKRKREEKRKRLGLQTDVAKKQRVDANRPASSSSQNAASAGTVGSASLQTNSSAGTVKTNYLPPRPPMVMFGSTQNRPGPWMAARHKRPADSDGQGKTYSLSTMWRYEKAKAYEPPPDINKLELVRPSEWPPCNTTTAPKMGNHPVSSPKENTLLHSPKARDNVPSPKYRLPLSGPRGVQLQNRISDSWKPNSPNPRDSLAFEKRMSEDSYRPITESPIHPHGPEVNVPGDSRRPMENKHSPPPILDRGRDSEERHVLRESPESDTRHDQGPDEEPIPPLPPRRPATIKGANYRRALDDNQVTKFWNPGEVFVYMYFGPEKKSIGAVRLCGLSNITKSKIINTKKGRKIEIWFQDICALEDYRHLCARSNSNVRFSNGWVEGYDDTEPEVYKFGQELRRGNLLAISYPEEPSSGRNVLLAFSPFSEDFEFLRDDHTISSDTFLYLSARNILPRMEKPSLLNRVSRPSIPARVEPQREQSPRRDRIATEQLSIPIEQRIEQRPSQTGPTHSMLPSDEDIPVDTGDDQVHFDALHEAENQEPIPTAQSLVPRKLQELSVENFDMDVFFENVFKMTFDVLAANNGPEKGFSQVFYLMCPPEDAVQKECEVLIEFLKKHRAVIFSNRLEEDWERFARTINRGVVVFHESFPFYDRMSSLKDLIQKSFTFWSFSLTGIGDDSNKTFFQRLFPHGGVILLTEDFMTREPDATIILLAWFYDWSSRKFPGSWKIMVRPNILEWLLDQPEPTGNERTRQGIWLVMYRLIVQLNAAGNASYSSEELLDGIHDDFSEKRVISPPSIPLYGSRTEDDCPNLPKGLTQEQRNTDHLAEFFAGWALVNSHRFRRFLIVTLNPQRRWTAWNHIDVKESARDFFKAYGVDYKMYWSKLKSTAKSGPAGDKKNQQTSQPALNIPDSISSPTISKPDGGFHDSKNWPTSGPSRL